MRKITIFTLVFCCAAILLIFYFYYPTLYQEEVEEMEVTLYFIVMTETDFVLYPVTRRIPQYSSREDIYHHTVELLIEGPRENEDVGPVLPENVVVKEVSVEGELVTLDFSQEIKEINVGARGEQITIYSIVNTLTEFPDIEEVQILIEGESRVSLAGHFLLMEPFTRSEEVIYRE